MKNSFVFRKLNAICFLIVTFNSSLPIDTQLKFVQAFLYYFLLNKTFLKQIGFFIPSVLNFNVLINVRNLYSLYVFRTKLHDNFLVVPVVSI